MTIWGECMSNDERYPECGREACIVLLKGANCIFCPAVRKLLREILTKYNVPLTAFREIDIDAEPMHRKMYEDIRELPTTEVCGTRLVGLVDETELETTLLQVIGMRCFHEGVTE